MSHLKSVRNYVFTILTAVSAFWPMAQASAAQCKQRITFLPQTHAVDAMTGITDGNLRLDDVAGSQLKIAQYLERFPRRPVFTEQLTEFDVNFSEAPSEERARLRDLMNTIFPYGLPQSAALLNQKQKEKLRDNGGEFIQMMRGQLQVLHKVVANKVELERLMSPIRDWFKTSPDLTREYPLKIRKLMWEAREKAALVEIKRYFERNPSDRDVILIYGANHSFDFYADVFPPECIRVPSEFQGDWNGRFRTSPTSFADETQGVTSSGASAARSIR